jgi:hypothetical protein
MNLIIFIWLLSTAMISFALPLPDYLWNLTDVTSKKLSKALDSIPISFLEDVFIK